MATFIVDELELKVPWYGRPSIDVWIKLKQYVYRRDGGLCQYCHEPVAYELSHCHHILELSENGTNHPTNLKTLCHEHHKLRHPFMLTARDKLR